MDHETAPSEEDLKADRRLRILMVVVLAVLIGAAWAWTSSHSSRHTDLHTASGSPAPALGRGFETGRGVIPKEGLSKVLAKATPAVANISSSRTVRLTQGRDSHPFFNDSLFRQFFGDQSRHQVPRERRERGLGSGVVVSSAGYILTNNHVVDGADEVRVAAADKRESDARIVGRDAKIDIEVLKIEAANLPTLTLADSSDVEVGGIVLAIAAESIVTSTPSSTTGALRGSATIHKTLCSHARDSRPQGGEPRVMESASVARM